MTDFLIVLNSRSVSSSLPVRSLLKPYVSLGHRRFNFLVSLEQTFNAYPSNPLWPQDL